MQTEKKTPEQDAPSISATYAQMAKDRAQAASDAADKPQPSSLAETLKPATAPSVPLPELPPKSLGELTAYLRKEIDDEPARKREESRQRTREMIASIGDMGRALANLGFTSNYAPNAYDHEAHSVTGRMRQRWEKAKADRLANRDRHLNRLMQLYELEQGGADRAYKRKRDAEADKRAAAAEDRAVKEHNLRIPILEGQARKAKADAQKAEVQAEYEAARIISVIGRNNRTGKGKVSASVGRGAGAKRSTPLRSVKKSISTTRRQNLMQVLWNIPLQIT